MRRREYGIVSGLMLTAVVLLSGCALSDTRAETTQQTDSPVIQAGQGEQENANGPGTVQRAASSEGKEEAATEEGSSAEVTGCTGESRHRSKSCRCTQGLHDCRYQPGRPSKSI